MPLAKEFSEDLGIRIVDLHEPGKGYKSISRSLDVHQSSEVKNNPTASAKNPKPLAHANIAVVKSMIIKILRIDFMGGSHCCQVSCNCVMFGGKPVIKVRA